MNRKLMLTCQKSTSLTLLLSLSIITGCTITRDATLRDAYVKGAINLPPVHLAEDTEGGRITISPHINYTPSENLKADVDPTAYVNKKNGGFSTKNLTKINEIEQINSFGGNLTWEIPKFSGGLDFEIFPFKSFGITGSYNFASGGSNGSVGLALQSAQKGVGIRLDVGLLFNNFSYEAYSTVEERTESIFGSESATYYFYDIGSSDSRNFYVTLTINSAKRESLIGFLLSLGYFSQTILDYNPGNLDEGHYLLFPPLPVVIINNTRLECTAGYFNLLPAIFANMNDNIRIIGGVRMNTEIVIGSGDVNFWPFIQTEFSF